MSLVPGNNGAVDAGAPQKRNPRPDDLQEPLFLLVSVGAVWVSREWFDEFLWTPLKARIGRVSNEVVDRLVRHTKQRPKAGK